MFCENWAISGQLNLGTLIKAEDNSADVKIIFVNTFCMCAILSQSSWRILCHFLYLPQEPKNFR
jgi:hypothetical protein